MFTDTQLREIFHFSFLERLLKISDPAFYILKGGVNLRFFFNSPRYSEDMDLDVLGGSIQTLKKNGYKILEDASFNRNLSIYGIEEIDINDPVKAKHTETTQRFRLGLINSSGIRLPTKVEFSRRESWVTEPPLEMIHPEIARQYKKIAYSCLHYSGEIAAVQKIHALAGRPATQARDVFDLFYLHAGGYTQDISDHPELTLAIREQAAEALLSLTYQDYEGQVLEFLDEEAKAENASDSAWAQMQETILRLIDHA